MATLNLGRIKPVFRGAYSGSTAYVVDDIVTHGNESFICIQAHGAGTQATSVTAYWTKLAAKGTDGTDVGTTITTQGDILYRDGSGLQRLAKGTGLQQFRMNAGATAPEWATVSGGSHTKIAEFTSSGTPTHWALDEIFSSTYDLYMIYLTYIGSASANRQWYWRFRTGGGSGANDTSAKYSYMYVRDKRDSGSETNANDGAWEHTLAKIFSDDVSWDAGKNSFARMMIHTPYNSDQQSMVFTEGCNNGTNDTRVDYTTGATVYQSTAVHTGISFSAQDVSSGVRNGVKAWVYGIKY